MSDIVRLLPHYRGLPIKDILSNFMFMLLNVYVHPEGV